MESYQKGDDGTGGEGKYIEANVFGKVIAARHLGVILDTSPSMQKYLPMVRATIAEKFPDLMLIETKGSFINQVDDTRWWWAEPSWAVNPFKPEFFRDLIEVDNPFQYAWNAQIDAGNAVLAMAELAGFDALYWFTDFDDPMDELSEFCERLEVSGIKMYIHPQNGRAPSLLRRVVEASGGEIIDVDLDKLPKTPQPPAKPVTMEPGTPETPEVKAEDAANQKVKFQFYVYETENKYGDLLQDQMLEPMTSRYSNSRVADKMRQDGKATFLKSLDFITTTGERVKEASTDQFLMAADEVEFVDGLVVEVDSRSSNTGLDVNLSGTFARKDGRDIRVYRLTTGVEMTHDRQKLLARWQEGTNSVFLIGSAYLEKPPTAIDPNKKPGVHLDVSFYKSVSDIQGGRAPVARTVVPARFGQRAKSESFTPIVFDAAGSEEYSELGLTAAFDATLDPEGTRVNAKMKLDFSEQPGGNERVPSGESVVKFDFHKYESSHTFTGDKPELLELSRAGFLNANPGPSKWVAVAKSILPRSLGENYAAAKLSMVGKPFEEAVQTANMQYGRALTGALKEARLKGDVETVTAVGSEIETLKAGKMKEAKPPVGPVLTNLRKTYLSLIRTATNNQRNNQRKLDAMFPGYTPSATIVATSKIQAKPAMAAAKVLPVRKEEVPTAMKQSTDATPDAEFGKLVFEGVQAGQPLQVPDELEDEPIGWVRIRDGRRCLIGTKTKGVFEMSPEGELTQVYPTYARKFALGFGRTVLTGENELRWRLTAKKQGTRQGVQDFEVGTGPKGEVILILNLDGTIELIHSKMDELEWDFKEWASSRRFTDIAITRWKGTDGIAMALDDKGELFAFSRLGFYKMPDEMKTGVSSISSGLAGINLAVLKTDGVVHEFTQPLGEKGVQLPQDSYLIENWKILAAETTASKPVGFNCGVNARAVQLEDGTWTVFHGRWAFTKMIFQEVTRKGKFKDLQAAFRREDSQFVLGIR